MKKYNYKGVLLEHQRPSLSNPSFGKRMGDRLEIYWPKESADVDSDGFDKNRKCGDGAGYKQIVILPKGTHLCRYGSEQGRFTADFDVDYSYLGLPYNPDTIEYHEYIVVADGLEVIEEVVKGFVAPAFHSPGGAVQYKHFHSIAKEIRSSKLQEMYLWGK